MRRKLIFFSSLLLVCLLAIITRFYSLGSVPGGLAWDEAAIAYNGWSIWQTRRDEWLVKLPISFRSFGDYKAPLAIYLNGFFTKFFGISSWIIRLPFAVAGVLAVFFFMLLVYLIFLGDEDVRFKKTAGYFSFLAGLLMTTSPWHHHFSRIGFESGLSLSMTILGFLGLEGTKKLKTKKFAFWFNLLSLVVLALTLYTYHSNKLVTPLLLVYWAWINRDYFRSHLKSFSVSLAGMLLVLVPFLKDALWGEGLTRAGVNIFSSLPFPQSAFTFIQNYLIHLSPKFLVLGETTTLRHGDGRWGVLLPTTFILLLFYCLFVALHLIKKKPPLSYAHKLALGWMLIGLLPAALGKDVPHSNRALQALPGFLLVALLAYKNIWSYLKSRRNQNLPVVKLFIGGFLIAHLSFFGLYLKNYYTNFKATAGNDFQFGYRQAVLVAENYIHGVFDDYPVEKVIFTSDYQQPYIYTLLFKEVTPYQYHNGVLSLYEFKDNINIGDLSRNNVLVIASKYDHVPHDQADRVILGTDGQPRFYIFKTQDKTRL